MDRKQLEQRLEKQLEETNKFFNLWMQSQGACAMLQDLIKNYDAQEGDNKDDV